MRSTITWSDRSAAGSTGSRASPAATSPIPSGVAFTTRSAAGTSAAVPTRPRLPASWAARAAGSGDRLTTATSAAPAPPRARATARPAPPAPTTTHRRPATSTPWSRRRSSRNPAPSVLSPTSRSPCRNTQFTAPRSAATAVRSSTASWTAPLWGIVTDRPPMPSVRMAATTSAPRPSATSNAVYTQSRPAAAKAAFMIVGESEWRTGLPTTAARCVAPEITPGSPSALAGLLAALLGREEFAFVVVGEQARPVVLGDVEDVPVPVALGRRERRLDARLAGRRDRGGRQADLVARVVRRVEAGLALDHRRHDQHLVRREAQRGRPLVEPQLGGHGLELVDHPPDHDGFGVALLDRVGLREQRALHERLAGGDDRRGCRGIRHP